MSSLDAIVRDVTHGRHGSLDALIDRWHRFVVSVEAGYPLTIYDYHNDLDIRSLLQDVLDRLTAGEREHVMRSRGMMALDRRFMHATRETSEVIATRDRGEWADRVPLKPGPELEADLVDRGLSSTNSMSS